MTKESEEIVKVPEGVKHYIDSDVLTEAKKRIHHIYDTFDHVFVSFSGGKDSLVVLELASECMRERGGKDSDIKVIFRDEELIPDEVLGFVQDIYNSHRFDMKYYCLQMIGHKMVLGKKETIIQWDATRRHIRPMPEYAISDPTVIYDQYTSNLVCTEYAKGKICMMLGLRAAESLHRLNGIKSVKNNTHIAGSGNKGISNGRPIYDWLEKDVFRYFYDRQIKYNPTYDAQMYNGQPLRVSSTINAEISRYYDKFKKLYPVYFDQVLSLFPDLKLQMLYHKQFNPQTKIDQYPHTFAGILQYINENLDGSQKAIATKRVVDCMAARERKQKADPSDPFGGYPLLYLFEVVLKGQYKRPVILKPNPGKAYFEYEGLIYPHE